MASVSSAFLLQAGDRVTRRVHVGELTDGTPIELPVMTIGGTPARPDALPPGRGSTVTR